LDLAEEDLAGVAEGDEQQGTQLGQGTLLASRTRCLAADLEGDAAVPKVDAHTHPLR
jgi:hypothetical protein